MLAFSAIGTELQGRIPKPAFRLGDQGQGPITAIDGGPLAAILHGFLFGLLEQFLDFVFAEIGAALNTDALLAAGGAVGGRNLQQAIGIDVEGHLYLGNAAGSRRDAGEAEATKGFVVFPHLPFAL